MAPRPRGGDWLNDEISSWRLAGVDTVLSTLTRQEEEDLDLANERSCVEYCGLKFHSLPIPDRDVPPSQPAVQSALRVLELDLRNGKSVIIHCRQGVGRSGMLAACLLIKSGLPVDRAIETVSVARGLPVPETEEQIRWLTQYSNA